MQLHESKTREIDGGQVSDTDDLHEHANLLQAKQPLLSSEGTANALQVLYQALHSIKMDVMYITKSKEKFLKSLYINAGPSLHLILRLSHRLQTLCECTENK